MNFRRVEANGNARHWVECYWIIESDDPTPRGQKIIPDGYPEIIFHFGDPYRINTAGNWETQPKNLFAGQIRQHFYLANTGHSSMLGIKLKSVAPHQLFDIEMGTVTNKVVDLSHIESLSGLDTAIHSAPDMDERVKESDKFFSAFHFVETPISQGIEWIIKTKGTGSVQELCTVMEVSERQAERLFQKFIGLSPKFYCRIIRFNAIFQLLSQHDPSWAELAYEAGFADQSHFIRNFKAFTGEEPSAYGFDEKTLANFFLKKS